MNFSFTRLLFSLFVLISSQLQAQNYNLTQRAFLDFPDQTLANVCGWTAPDGHEYGLLGASKGLIIIDLANPEQPRQIVQIPGPDNLWKEIKVYKHYAYVTSEGGQGLQIVDLSALPSANLQYHSYTGTGALAGALNAIHALHIDTAKGFVYLFGGNQSYASIHSLEPDPYNPTYAGAYNNPAMVYIHDGYANNDTLYACHIYAGKMAAVDCTNKANPVVLGDVVTPNQFTHNCWPITSNRHVMLTTDERDGSYLAAYDTRDPQNITELDRMQTTPGSGSVVHNTHVTNDFAVSSWYTDGINIVDARRPQNLVQVGRFDTFGGSGGGFDGCWGVYPFFPSGTIITTNIGDPGNQTSDPTRMYVLSPTYKRACYLEGKILDNCNGLPLSGATIKITSNDPLTETTSNNAGDFKTGQPTPGSFSVTISKQGYISQTVTVNLATEQVTPLNITLAKGISYNTQATAKIGTAILANRTVQMLDPLGVETALITDAQGKVSLTCAITGDYKFGVWGAKNVLTKTINSSAPIALDFQAGYYDDCEMDLGWTKEQTATVGTWVREVPIGTQNGGLTFNPGADATTDQNDLCYVTGNGAGGAGTFDVDNGFVSLISPVTNLTGYSNPVFKCQLWFANGGGNGGAPNDKVSIRVSNGITEVLLWEELATLNAWKPVTVSIKDKIALTSNMLFTVIASDDDPGHLVEAAIDVISIEEGPVATFEPTIQANLEAQPNPFSQSTLIKYQIEDVQSAILEVTDALGSVVESQLINQSEGQMSIGTRLPSGVYLVRLRSQERTSSTIKLVKQ